MPQRTEAGLNMTDSWLRERAERSAASQKDALSRLKQDPCYVWGKKKYLRAINGLAHFACATTTTRKPESPENIVIQRRIEPDLTR